MAEFPAGFVWGAATAAHQIEGGNVNSDWWEWEHHLPSGCAEPSGDACDSFHRWREDVELVAQLGLGAYRFSLEWSRIEPAEGEWSVAALDHYRRMCAACRGYGIQPVVTLHHFTLPRWLAAAGGWEAPDAPDRFAGYAARVGRHLGDLVASACTINEPGTLAELGYLRGSFPPGVRSPSRHRVVVDAMIRAHRLAADALRDGPGQFPVGLTMAMAGPTEGADVPVAGRRADESALLDATAGDDFVGVHCRVAPKGDLGGEEATAAGTVAKAAATALPGASGRGWATERAVRRAAASTGLPIVVTETAAGDGAGQIAGLTAALEGLDRCVEDGIDVRGCFVWSLLDGYQWERGFRTRPGLVGVDRRTFERRPKKSAFWLSTVARANAVPPAGRPCGGPATMEPGSVGPATMEPGSVGPATMEPGSVGPATMEPGAVRRPGAAGSGAEGGARRLPRVGTARPQGG